MTKATYATIPSLIATRTPFVHGSCHGIWHGETYAVYSYRTLIATDYNGKKELNATKYSMTTSRLQNIIRKAWSI